MTESTDRSIPKFEPLRPATRSRRIAVFVLGPFIWLIAILLTATVVHFTNAVEIGLVVTLTSFLVAFVGLYLMRVGRRREERRFASVR